MTPIKLSDIPQDSRLAVAEQIAANLTAHNKLLVAYTAEKILADETTYLVLLGSSDHLVIGSIQVRKVQWYQAETCHLTVHPAYRRQGFGTALKHAAENQCGPRARRSPNARYATITRPAGNFRVGAGWSEVSAFRGDRGNTVRVYQKTL